MLLLRDDMGIEPNVVTYNVLLNEIFRKAKLQPHSRFESTITFAEKVLDEIR